MNAGQQQLYEERTGAAGIRMPGQVHVPTMPVDTRGADIMREVSRAGEAVGGILAREYAWENRLRMEEVLLDARKEFSAWREGYMRDVNGRHALGAREDFSAKMREIAGRRMAEFGGRPNEIYPLELGGHMEALVLRAEEQGADYASGQRSLWERSVLEGARAQLLADAETDPENGAWLDFQLGNIAGEMEKRGLDATATLRDLSGEVQLRRGLGYVRRGELDAASAILQGWKPGGEHPGDLSARYESGAAGSAAIGYDKKGGTSYGRFQLSSKKGSMEGFLRFLEGRGGEAASMAARLRAAGPSDTGGKDGAMPDAWKKEAQAPGFADLEREYIQREFYEPVMRSLPSGAAAAVKASPQLGQMVWSTAVQHGAAGAGDILRKVWRDGMTPEDFVRAAYAERATRFGGSEPDVRASVLRRLRREADDLLGGLAGRGGVNGMDVFQASRLEGAIAAAGRQNAAEARLAAADFSSQLAYGMERGDFSAALETHARVLELGATDEAKALMESLRLHMTAASALSDTEGLPLARQAEAAVRRVDELITPENAEQALALRKLVEKTMNERQKRFLADPAGYVAALSAASRPAQEQVGPPLPFGETAARRLLEQEMVGEGLPFVPRLLSLDEKRRLRATWDAESTPEGRAAWLLGLRDSAGARFTQALREMDMPEAVIAAAPVLDELPQREAGIFLSAAALKGAGDIPGVDEDRKREARDRIGESAVLRVLMDIAADYPASDAARARARGFGEALFRAELMGMSPELLDARFDVVDEEGMRLIIPRRLHVDTDDLEEVMSAARDEVRRTYLAANPAAPGSVEDRLNREKVESLARHARFITDADGTGAILVDGYTQAPVLLPDGRPVRVDYADVTERARDLRGEKNLRAARAARELMEE